MRPGEGERAAPLGNIESLFAATIAGWGVGASAAPVDVQARADGLPVQLRVQRQDRPDVRIAYPGEREAPDGFVVELDGSVWFLADANGTVPLIVHLDGCEFPLPRPFHRSLLDEWWRQLAGEVDSDEHERQSLRFLAHVFAAGGPKHLAPDVGPAVARALAARGLEAALHERDGARRIARAARQQVRLESFDGLVLVGWASDPVFEPQVFRVLGNGIAIECRVDRQDRADVRQAFGHAEGEFGFRIELPAGIWAQADADGRCSIDVFIEGHRLTSKQLVLEPELLRQLAAAATNDDDTGAPFASEPRRLVLFEQHADALAERGLFTQADRAAVAALAVTIDPADHRHDAGAAPPDQALAPHALRAVLESSDDLVLAGWVLDETEGGELFRLVCNGRDVGCQVLRTHRDDVRKALGAVGASEFLGFEIQLPAEIWRHADADGVCDVSLLVNGLPLPIAPLRLDRAALEQLVLARFGQDAERALRVADPAAVRGWLLGWLLAEHVAASGGIDRFGPAAQTCLRAGAPWIEAARRGGIGGETDSPQVREEQQVQRRVWRLQRRLNALLAREGATKAVDLILSDVDATGAVREQLLLSLVPLMCDDDAATTRIQRDLPLEVQALHAARGDNWHRSLYLVGLVRSGRFADACAVLERIVASPTHGWLNTDCIACAVGVVLRSEADDVDAAGADSPARERLVELFVELLESLPGGYWSRRHDRRLVETMADVVAVGGDWPEARARRCRDAALRHYGLVPSFWARLDALAVSGDAVVARAREDFDCVRAIFDGIAETGALPGGWREGVERLRLQHLGQRRIALQCLRELMLADLGGARARGNAEDLSWRFVWEWASPADQRRLDAFPLPRAGQPRLPAGHLWPTPDAPAASGDGPENRLDLRSPPERIAALSEAAVLVVCVVRNEHVMLPHFLAHYRGLGVRHFVFVDNGSDDGTAEYLLAQPDAVLYAADTDYRDSHYGVAWQQAVLAAHGQGRWAVVADADELLMYRDCETVPLPALVARLAAEGHDAASILMLDMYPRGALRDTDFARVGPDAANWFDREPLLRWRLGTGLYSNSPTWLSALRHRLIPHSPPNAFTTQKTALLRYRPWVRLSEGLHYAAGLSPAAEPLFFGHYKYHAGFREKVLREIERKQHYDGASEYAQYVAMIAEPQASLFAPDVSVALTDSRALPAMDARAEGS